MCGKMRIQRLVFQVSQPLLNFEVSGPQFATRSTLPAQASVRKTRMEKCTNMSLNHTSKDLHSITNIEVLST